jgi:SAM-dependent methyltransferase
MERVVFALGIVPTPLLFGFWGMGTSRVVISGTRLGVFEALADGPRTAEEVARGCGCDPGGMETLLDALNGFGYVRRRGGRYRNARQTTRWLLERSKPGFRDAMFFYADLWDALGSVEEGVRTGVPLDFHHAGRPPEFWDRYMRALAGFARLTASEIVRRVRLDRDPRTLLDVGGGHGVYSVEFCRRYPGLVAEVLDLPQAAERGRLIVAEEGMAERVAFRVGDMRTDEWGSGLDVVLLFNVLHNLTEEESRAALAHARQALAPGGTLIVVDSEHVGGSGDLSTTGGFNELFFYVVSGTRAYPEGVLQRWMTEAGFSSLARKRLFTVPNVVCLVGRK